MRLILLSMPLVKYRSRQICLMVPNEDVKKAWLTLAKEVGMTLSAWIVARVENSLFEDSAPIQEITTQKSALQEENRKLRIDLGLRDARLRELETEVFKAQHAAFLQNADGEEMFSKGIVEVLRSGGIWPGQDLLRELGVDVDDAKALQVIHNQLTALQDFGLAAESARGWKWIG